MGVDFFIVASVESFKLSLDEVSSSVVLVGT